MRPFLRYTLLGLIGAVLALFAWNAGRHFIYWSPTEDVTIDSGGIPLAGTLITPSGDGPFPVMLMLHGSGPEQRGDPATRALSNALARMGVASLIYDKRGTGHSGGDFDTALYSDFIDDALAALRYLESRPGIDRDRIGLYTVSESGWFGPEIALRNGNVQFLYGKVACPLSWERTVAFEVRNEFLDGGVAEEDVDALVTLVRQRWDYYQAVAADPSLAAGPRRAALNAEIARLRASIPGAADAVSAALLDYDPAVYQAIAADTSYDTRPWIGQLAVPQYYAFAGRDVNMPTSDCVNYLETLRARTGRDIAIAVYPQAGHSLLHWTGFLSLGYVPGYLDEFEGWVSRQLENAR